MIIWCRVRNVDIIGSRRTLKIAKNLIKDPENCLKNPKHDPENPEIVLENSDDTI